MNEADTEDNICFIIYTSFFKVRKYFHPSFPEYGPVSIMSHTMRVYARARVCVFVFVCDGGYNIKINSSVLFYADTCLHYPER